MFELLIVDDEKFVVDNLSTTFPWEQLGVDTIHTAYSGSEALSIVQYHNIHIVITDIRMPGMSGIELINHIKEISNKTKCILLSGYSEFEYAQKAVSSQVQAYLLKPVKENELLATVKQATEQIQAEWQEVISRQRTMYTLSEHLPLLRSALLDELLQGKSLPAPTLSKKLEMLNLDARMNQPFAMMFIRMEQGFEHYGEENHSLMEYSISNICEEIFGGVFALWHNKDLHGNLIFVITPRVNNHADIDGDRSSGEHSNERNRNAPFAEFNEAHHRKILEKNSLLLQESVLHYLKGTISVLISEWGIFPNDLYAFYQKSISVIRNHPEGANGIFISSLTGSNNEEFQPLRSIQEPPALLHLLEAGRWDDAEDKYRGIIEEMRGKKKFIHEYMIEIAYMVSYSISHAVHKQGWSIERFTQGGILMNDKHEALRSIDSLLQWGLYLIHQLKANTMDEVQGSQRTIIQQINEFVQLNLEHDVSLQTIADHVYLHPAYVSKIYKMGTGEGLSEYIYRLRMERAAHMLTETKEKIHEISKKTGYQNPSHFSRVFKKYYNMTPDDYRCKVK